ncbi:MAG: RluA family pseudouridine synthase [Oscillospiraceae bacterium]|nr:RluA family pseudouridine synthase [Oscillospiraceae bacterium]
MNRFEFFCESQDEGARVDKWLTMQDEVDLTRSSVAKLIEQESVLINGKFASKSTKLSCGDTVVIEIPDPVDLKVEPQDIPIEIIYQDDDLLVVNKPQGMVVHPAPGNPDGTLVNALLFKCKGQLSSINGVIRPGIVHRIDKNTSGLLIVAKNDFSHNKLSEQIKAHSFTREYEAVCVGRFKEKTGTIDAPIGRDKNDRKRMCVTAVNSKNATTHYEVLEEFGNYSYVRFKLETGRTHQIRVHSSFIGHPILGDDVYGKAYKNCKGQCLHARKIGFIHPSTDKYMEFTSELPEYFIKILNSLR